MSFSSVMNNVTNVAQNVRSTLNKVGALGSSEVSNSSIRDRYVNGFYGDTTQFRPNIFSRLFDEPTYLTFRIEFDFNQHKIENSAKIGDTNDPLAGYGSLDYMPEPFLVKYDNSNSGYSTCRYLRDAVGDIKRADMMSLFIRSLEDIQNNYPYYFTSIDGLHNLSTVHPDRGIRLSDDNNTIKIGCYEALDLRITQLMQLYRKIVWDDVYQRWVLPDMMRFFSMKIYVSEIRLFHSMSVNASNKNVGRLFDFNSSDTMNATSYDKLSGKGLLNVANGVVNTALGISNNIFGQSSGISKFLDTANTAIDSTSSLLGSLKGNMKLCDNAINNVMPTIMYECKMCEFDVSDTLSHISNLSSSKDSLKPADPELVIKVGKVYEHMMFPLQRGLEVINNSKYRLNTTAVGFSMFDDKTLQESGTARYTGNTFNEDTNISSKHNRINQSFGKINSSDETYDPYTPDKKTAITSLATGIAGYFGTSYREKHNSSEATTGDYVNDLRNMYKGNADKTDHSSTAANRQPTSTERTTVHESTATHQPRNKFPEAGYELEIDPYGTAAKERQLLQSDIQELHESTAVTEGEKIPDIIPEPLHVSTATTQERKIVELINEDGYENVLSAATSIKEVIKYIDEGDVIKSTATDESAKNYMKNVVLNETLTSLSTATDPDNPTVRKLAGIILSEYNVDQSTATNIPAAKRESIKNTFSYLNGNS